MKYRDLFILIIRLGATYGLFRYLINSLPHQIMLNVSLDLGTTGTYSVIAGSLLIILIYWLVVQKAAWFVDTLGLTKGFENDSIDFRDLTELSIYRASFVILSGYIFLITAPGFLTQIYFRFRADVSIRDIEYSNDNSLLYYSIELLLSILILSNSKRIAKWFSKD